MDIANQTKKFISRHLLMLTAALVLSLVYAGVSQVRSIFSQALNSASSGGSLWDWGFLLCVIFGGMFFFGSAMAVVPWPYRWLPRPPKDAPANFLEKCYLFADKPIRFLQYLMAQMARKRLVSGLTCTLVGLLLLIGATVWPDGGKFNLWGTSFQNLALILSIIGALLLFAPSWLKPDLDTAGYKQEKQAACRVFCWWILCMVGSEIVWFIDGRLFRYYPSYTLWAFAQFSVSVLLGASLADYLHHHLRQPARLYSLVVVGVVLWVSQSPLFSIGSHPSSPPSPATLDARWYDHVQGRLEAMTRKNLPGPAVIVVASGGGSRAALFTSLVLDRLAREPMAILSPGIVPEHPAEKATWGDHVLMISSVSGGSLATAHHVHRGGSPSGPPAILRSASEDSLRKAVDAAFTRWLAKEGNDPEMAALVTRLQAGLNTFPLTFSDYFDDMGTDFMAPVLRGTLTPVMSRGTALTVFWMDRFEWGLSSRFRGYGPNGGSPAYDPATHPAVLFNATDADKGTRLIVGFPPLPKALVRCDFERLSGNDRVPVEIGALDPGLDLSLGEAVRLSANFPWGFQIAKVSPEKGPSLRVLDGGVVDNGGLDSLHYVIKGLQTEAESKEPRAIQLLNLLRRRGLLIVEIDSGAKPDDQSSIMPWAWATNPSKALSNATYTNADLTREYHRNALQALLKWETPSMKKGGAELAPVLWGLLQCNHGDRDADVMTSWALGPTQKGIIVSRFLVEWERWDRKKLAEEALALQKSWGTATAAAAIENTREQTARLKADMEKSTTEEEKQKAVVKFRDRLKQQVEYLESAQLTTDQHSADQIGTVLKTLKTGQNSLGADPSSVLRTATSWDLDAVSRTYERSLDPVKYEVQKLRDERQQMQFKTSEFFEQQKQMKK